MGQLIQSKASGTDLAGTIVTNFLLSILTLGLFYFWGKSRIRRYIWATTYIDDEPLQYEGTGLEMFLGSLISILGLAFFGGAGLLFLFLAPSPDAAKSYILLFLVLPVLFFFKPLLHFRSIQYLASRTRLRGIRWSVQGSAIGYALRYALRLTLTVITLGLAYPWMRAKNWRDRVQATSFGDACFVSEAKGRDLLLLWLVCLALSIPTATLSLFYYRAYEQLYCLNSTSLVGMRLSICASRVELMWLKVTSAILLIVTLGLAYPWVLARQIRWWSSRASASTAIDYSRIHQRQSSIPILGDTYFAQGLPV